MVAQSHAFLITINAQPEFLVITARKQFNVFNVHMIMTIIVVLWLQTAQPFANLTSKNAKHLEKMKVVAHSLINVLSKSVIIMENFATYIAPVYVMIIRSYVQVIEMKRDAKNLPSVYHLPKNYGEKM
jgi:hypothetical protein